MNPAHITLALLMSLSGCSLVSTQAVYEEIRAQEKAKAVGTGAAPSKALPHHDQYEKERGQLAANHVNAPPRPRPEFNKPNGDTP